MLKITLSWLRRKLVRLRGGYVVFPRWGAYCHRIHRPWCPNVKYPKHRGRKFWGRWYRTLEKAIEACGQDRWLPCQLCMGKEPPV